MDWTKLTSMQPLLVDYGGRILAALILFWVGKWLAKRFTRALVAILEKKEVDLTLVRFLEGIVYYTLLVAVILAAAGQLGIKTTSFLAVLGAVSLAVGLALKDSLGNFSAGVLLILFRPFRVKDVVTVAGETGVVQEISVFSTILTTGDNQRKIIPNGSILKTTITNITANPTRRIDLVIGIGYEDDLRLAKEILEQILSEEPRVLAEPKPTIALSELGESSVNLVVRPWVKTEDYWNVYYALMEAIKFTFDEKNISFPYPQRDVHLMDATPSPNG